MNRVPLLLPVLGALCALVLGIAPALAYETEDCIRCHDEGSSESRLRIPVQTFRSSVHADQLECLDCHTESGDDSHRIVQTARPVDCRSCHDQVNLHGQPGGGAGLPQCDDCHTQHGILPPSSPGSSVHPGNLRATCSGCHPVESGQVSTLKAAVFFRLSAHRKGDLSGAFDAGRCVDCHQGGAAHGEEGLLNEARCQACHGSSPAKAFLLGTFHGATVTWSRPGPLLGQSYYFLLLLAGSCLFWVGLLFRVRLWRSGRSEPRKDSRGKRVASFLAFGLGQKKVFEDRLAGFAHLGIFVGFLVPLAFLAAAQVSFAATTPASRISGLLLDLSGLAGMAGVVLAAFRRGRRQRQGLRSSAADWLTLALLFSVFFSGFLIGAARTAVLQPEEPAWTPVRFLFSTFVPADPVWTAWVWRVHFLLALGLVAFLPYSKLRHALTGPLNAYYRDLDRTGAAGPVVLRRGLPFGASRRQEFTWKQLLDADACMGCGRCEQRCPAAASGTPLSPRKVIGDLRRHMASGRVLPAFGRSFDRETDVLLGKRIAEEEVWACTTCHACRDACPVFVEPVRTLLDLRRHLVLGKARFPSELKGVFRKMEVYGDPYGKGRSRRADWARDVPVRHVSPETPVEVLLWVGCEGAFHERNRSVAVALAGLLTRAGLEFGVLGKQELCCGDLARRTGNEYLFQRLARENIRMLRGLRFRQIVTLCPHCFHTLKNEYPPLGGDFSVLHYSELLSGLLGRGKLRPARPVAGRATFHDPCYLGRVNGSYEDSRSVLRAIPGLDLVEMERCRDLSFCCGAGGGRVWMHEQPGRRMNRLRAEEALSLQVGHVVTSCPYCLSMFEDGLRSADGKSVPRTRDLAELVLESMGDP